jgi:hypothetical protein
MDDSRVHLIAPFPSLIHCSHGELHELDDERDFAGDLADGVYIVPVRTETVARAI